MNMTRWHRWKFTCEFFPCRLYQKRQCELAGPAAQPVEGWSVALYKALPLRTFSRLWGRIHDKELPEWSRPLLLGTYARLFGCDMLEAERGPDFKSYKNLGELFRRRLKPGCRPVDEKAAVVAPCDGCVDHAGHVDEGGGLVPAVKGVTYPLNDFLGGKPPLKRPNSSLYQVILYLAPGDYHGFHAPTEWRVEARDHFPGLLLSVRPKVVAAVRNLFALNERVVYRGKWTDDDLFFSFAAVGATNVGSIVVHTDEGLSTNEAGTKAGQPSRHRDFPAGGFEMQRGDLFGTFNMGSTVVLVFEVPAGVRVEMAVERGQRVRMGQALLRFLPILPPPASSVQEDKNS
jgi:phosphatidylserine decarboxylase